MQKLPFPVEALIPKEGTLRFNAFGGSIELPLEPFDLLELPGIRAKVVIDCLPIAPAQAGELSGKTFDFRSLPDEIQPEGSVYIGYHHHPIDMIAMRFGPVQSQAIELEFIAALVFDFEGLGAGEDCEYANAVWQAKATLLVVAPDTQH